MSQTVAFIIPGEFEFGQQQYPIGVAYLAAVLRRYGHRCHIVDEIAGQNVETELERIKPDTVCLTGTTMFIDRSYAHARYARQELGARTIIGGPHASALPDEAAQHANIVIKNEAEGNITDAVEGRLADGIHEGVFIKDLDTLPLPAYDLMDIEHYLAQKDRIAGYDIKAAALITSRGCPWKCTFCYNSFRKAPVRFHSAERVIEEIEYFRQNHGVQGLYFCDDEFLLKPKRLAAITDYLKKEKLLFECQAQVRSLLKHPEVVGMIKDAGCVSLAVGFESGSERVLEELKQGASTVAMNQQVLDICKKEGLPVHGTFMIGNPGETMEDIRQTEAFINKNRKGFKYVSVLKTTPFPGTAMWRQCHELGILKPPYQWRQFDCGPEAPRANEHLTNEEIVQEVKRINFRQTLRNYSLTGLVKRAWRYKRFLANYLPFTTGGKSGR